MTAPLLYYHEAAINRILVYIIEFIDNTVKYTILFVDDRNLSWCNCWHF